MDDEEKTEAERTLASIRPDGSTDRVLTQQDATDVLQLAIQRLDEARQVTGEQLLDEIRKLKDESEETAALVRVLSVPPKGRSE